MIRTSFGTELLNNMTIGTTISDRDDAAYLNKQDDKIFLKW